MLVAGDKFIEAEETQAPPIDRHRCLFRSWSPPYRKSHLLKSKEALFPRLPSNCWVSNDMTSLRCSQDSLQLVSSLCGENGQFATERYYPRSGFARMWLLSSISNRYRIYEKQKEKEKIISLFFFQFIHSKLTFNNFYILKQLVNSKIYTRNVGAMYF